MSRPGTRTHVDQLRMLIDGHQVTMAISVAATLGIADLLRDGPLPVAELAQRTGSDERSLYRLLRALASVGVFHEGEDRRFSQSSTSEHLRSDDPESLAGWAIFAGRPYYREAWANLLHSVKTGETAFASIHDGQRVWEWRQNHPEENAIFNRAMGSLSGAVAVALAGGYDFSRFHYLVDVGGGNGSVLAAVLRANPGLRGAVFDLPHVVAAAGGVLQAADVNDRCDVIAGDFFGEVPAGADAYVLKNVLHDWDDESSIRILRRVRVACGAGATLLVVERVVGPPNGSALEKLSDLNMLALPGGQERTLDEWRWLFAKGGFRLADEQSLGVGWSVIAGSPA